MQAIGLCTRVAVLTVTLTLLTSPHPLILLTLLTSPHPPSLSSSSSSPHPNLSFPLLSIHFELYPHHGAEFKNVLIYTGIAKPFVLPLQIVGYTKMKNKK